MIYMDLKVHGGNKAFTVDEFLSSKVKDLKKECNTAVEDGGRGGKWLGSKKEGNCFYTTWCEQFSKDKKGCKKAKVGAKKVCKYKKAKWWPRTRRRHATPSASSRRRARISLAEPWRRAWNKELVFYALAPR